MKDPQFKRARNLLILNDFLHGFTKKQLAEKFRVSDTTIGRALDWVKRAGLVTQFEDRILQELVPESIETFKRVLKKDDQLAADVARDVFKGVGLLLKPQEKAQAPTGEGEDLEIYIRKIRRTPEEESRDTRFKPGHNAQLAAARANEIVQGSVIEDSADGGDEASAQEVRALDSDAGLENADGPVAPADAIQQPSGDASDAVGK